MFNFSGTRLDALQQRALEKALGQVTDPVYLFGSRANPSRKGGDVDILILSDQLYASHFEKSLKITVAYQAVCEEKIDVVIFPSYQNQTEVQRDFFDHIEKKQLQ